MSTPRFSSEEGAPLKLCLGGFLISTFRGSSKTPAQAELERGTLEGLLVETRRRTHPFQIAIVVYTHH